MLKRFTVAVVLTAIITAMLPGVALMSTLLPVATRDPATLDVAYDFRQHIKQMAGLGY